MFLTACTFLTSKTRASPFLRGACDTPVGFLQILRLGVTADPDGSNSRWRKQNILDRNIFREDTRSSHDILILMFFTSLGQCKVN